MKRVAFKLEGRHTMCERVFIPLVGVPHLAHASHHL